MDGTRALVYKEENKIKIVNRRGIVLNYRYPELPVSTKNIKAESAVLDTEIVVFDSKGRPDFYLLSEREHVDSKLKVELRAKLHPATIVVFDILKLNSKDLTAEPLIKRKKILKGTVKESERIKLCYYTENGNALWKEIRRMGLEGVMAKKTDSPYLFERSRLWLKIKNYRTLDCIICGYTTGTGRRKEMGSVITGAYYKGELVYTGKLGTGFSAERIGLLLKRLERLKTKCPFKEEPELNLPQGRTPVWVKPEIVCEVKYMNLSKDRIMRTPSFLRLRGDKSPEECVLK